ncbi:40S ribosomal protein S5-1 [Hordeum vulgare]|nr:40S ribosomal protein S5-1 [Hordeum vulgare]
MAASSSSKYKFFNDVINPYLREVMQHPQDIEMRDGVLHIHDVQGPKGTGSVEARLEAMEQEVFRCKGMVERGLNANQIMIADYTRDLKVDGKSMKDIVFSLNEKINFLHSQIHDLQSQVFEYEARFKGVLGGAPAAEKWKKRRGDGDDLLCSARDDDGKEGSTEELIHPPSPENGAREDPASSLRAHIPRVHAGNEGRDDGDERRTL